MMRPDFLQHFLNKTCFRSNIDGTLGQLSVEFYSEIKNQPELSFTSSLVARTAVKRGGSSPV